VFLIGILENVALKKDSSGVVVFEVTSVLNWVSGKVVGQKN